MSEKELAAELQKNKDRPEDWVEEEVDVGRTPRSRRNAVVSTRFAEEELDTIEVEAKRRGLTVSAYVRRAALTEALGRSRLPEFEVRNGFTQSGAVISSNVVTVATAPLAPVGSEGAVSPRPAVTANR